MQKNQKRLVSVALVCAIMFVVGAVYAAANGTLLFDGKATLTPNEVELVIRTWDDSATGTNDYMEDSLTDGSAGTMTVSADGQTATIEVGLVAPGDTLTFEFWVENTKTTDAEITAVNVTNDTEILLGGDYADILTNDNVIIGGGQSGLYSIEVTWNPAEPDATSDSDGDGVPDTFFVFTIELPYQLA